MLRRRSGGGADHGVGANRPERAVGTVAAALIVIPTDYPNITVTVRPVVDGTVLPGPSKVIALAA